jgi:hypothetical protein
MVLKVSTVNEQFSKLSGFMLAFDGKCDNSDGGVDGAGMIVDR